MKTKNGPKRIRSTTAPEISAAVTIAKVPWNAPKRFPVCDHADGMLSHGEALILWDNECTPASHLKQFDRYIRQPEKRVSGFIVIGLFFRRIDGCSDVVRS